MFAGWWLLALFGACSAAVHAATGGSGLTLTPAQVLLPSTSYYVDAGAREPLKVHVQVLLRVEPRVCVNWEVQNPELLRLFPPNNEENYIEYSIVPLSSFGEGCSSSIWAASLPSALRAQGSESGAPLRSWVFAYEASTKTRAGAEVVISPMRSIQFETRNRRISVNQVATLKIVGHDEFANTFTSLEGIPFEAQIEDPRIMEIIDLRHDPEVATRARVSLLDKRDRFAVSQGSTLTSDVIVLQGRTVGRTRISVRVMLPEYREIVLKDVEFTVSDSIDLEPGRLVLPPGAQFKFCVQKIKPQSQIDDTWDPTVDLTNYQWSVAGGAGQLVKPDGTLTTGKAGGVDFRVILTDRRNSETFVSDISVRVPQSLGLSYGGLQQMLDCYATKGVDIADPSNLPHNSLLAQLQQQVYAGCRGGMRCGLRYLAAAAGATPPAYLLLGRSYVFDVGMRDKDDTAIYVAEGYSFSWRVENAAIVGVTRSPNGRFVVISALAEGVTKVVVELAAPRVSIEFMVSVTDPVHLLGFPVETIDVPNQQGLRQVPRSEPLVGSTRPLVVPLNENAKLVARGGSGEYLWHVDDIGMCSTKQGILRCKAYGSTVLTVSDRLNPENVFKVQVVVQRMKRLELLPTQVHVEVGATAQFRLSAFADLADLAPLFSKSWGTASGEVGRFYSCMPLTYQVESAANAKLNCRVEHDRFMLDLTKVTEEPFSCGVFAYRTLHPGESEVSVSLMHEELMVMTELTASAKALIYDRLSLSVHPEYSQFPLKTPPQPFMNVSQVVADQSVFANVPIGGKVRLVVRGGPPMLANGLVVSTCNRSSAHLYVDKVDNAREGIARGRTMFDVYCLSETAGDKVCVRVDGVLRNEYTISCRLPSYVEIHPLVSANNQTVRDNLLHCSGYPVNWEDNDAVPTGVFSSGSNLCYKDESKTKWQIKTNADAMHAFRAVVFDAFGTPLCPSHSYKVQWSGSAAAGAAKSAELSFQKIDGSMFVYDSTTLADSDLVADLEWPDALDPRHTSAGAAAVLKPKSVTTQIAASKMWTKSTSRRGGYLLSTSLRVQPTLPHEILIGVSRTSLTPAEKRVSIFFNPRMRYQFAVALGSGNYVELTAYSESIKLQHSTTLTFSSAAEFAKLAAVVDGVTNLSDPLDLQKSVARYANTAMPPIPVKYLNFTCPQPCSRSLDIVDRSQLGQQTKTLIISQSPVSKLHIMITDIPDVESGVFEDLDVLSSLGGGINLLSVKRLYRVHAVALDGDGVPMSYASLSGLKFSVCSSNLVKLEHPKDVGFKAIGGAMVIQCLAEGKYTVRAEIRNFTGTTETPDGVLVSDSLEITAYRETSPVLASILMMPNSGEFHLSMLDGALSRSIPLQTAALETSDETVLQVVTSGQVGVIRAVKPGTCTMTSYIAGGTSSPSKSVTPITVAIPYSVAVSGPSQILNGKSVVLYAKVSDYSGRPFTPIFVLGSSESATSSYCAFTWSVSGHGVFLEEGERTATVSGAGRGRVTLIATAAGAITVALRASCRNLSASGTLELVAPKFAVESLVHSSVFGSHISHPIILSPNSTYESLVGVVEPIASSDVGLLTVDGTSGQTTLKTESKTGHVLLKTADSYVTHVQVHEVNQLHVHSYGVQSSEISVLKSGKKELTVQLKTRDGRRILPPVDLRLKYMLSNSSLFRVTLSGHSIHVAANSADGCSSLMVLLDENDEQFTGTNMVVDTIRLCVVNALTPQDALVLKGSTVRFLAGDSRTFSIQMRGAPLAHAYTSIEHQDTLQYYQDAILSRMGALMSDIKSDLSRGLINVFRDIGLEESGCVDSLEMHQPYLEVSQYVNGLKPLYVFPFSICREVDSVTFTAKLTAFLQELGRSADSVFSMMEGGVSAISDNATIGAGVTGMLPSTKSGQNATSGEGVNAAQPSAVTGNWTVDEPDILSVSDSQGVALAAGSTVVKYSSEYMKGDSRITVFEAVTKVEYQHLADSAVRANATNMKPVFGTTIAYKEFYEPFYVVFKAATAGGSYVHNTLQVDSRVFAVCELVSKETWVKEVFGSEATYVVGSSATEFLPACRISIRSFGGKTEWNKMRNVLKGASESAYGLKLKVALYSTLPSDHKSPARTPSKQQSTKSTATDAAAAQPLWVSLRKVDALLSEQSFDWKLPVFAQFVDSVGIAISDVSVEPGKAVAISVYPHYSRCKLRVDGSHYKLRITEHQGLLCSFALENDGVVEPSSVQLVCQRTVAATLKISHPSVARLEVPTSVVTTEVRTTYGVDWMLIVFTACLAAGLAYLIYTLLHRPDIRYYETTEPIKIERRLPNVFEKLYQTDYHGSTSSTSVQYQHRRRL